MIKIIIPLLIFFGCSNVNSYKNSSNHNILKGINLYSQGNKIEALNEYNRLLKNNSKNIVILREMGIIESQLGYYTSAKKRFFKILEIDPNDVESIRNLTYIYFIEKKYNMVIIYGNKIPKGIRIDQDNIVLAHSYYENKKYKESILIFNKIKREIIYNNLELGMSFLDTLVKNEDKELLFCELKKIDITKDTNPELIIFISQIYSEKLNDYEKSENILKEYLNDGVLNDKVLLTLAKLYYKVGKKKECRNVINMISDDYKYNLEYIEIKTYVNY